MFGSGTRSEPITTVAQLTDGKAEPTAGCSMESSKAWPVIVEDTKKCVMNPMVCYWALEGKDYVGYAGKRRDPLWVCFP